MLYYFSTVLVLKPPEGGASGMLQQHKTKRAANVRDISFILVEVRQFRIFKIFNIRSPKTCIKKSIEISIQSKQTVLCSVVF